ncbi:DUF5818 domain-containing protein [Novosphingobium sp. H3SJ31-1]|uniref:DUF5818 domain-containing protein n=2 Tax=Novosphingobium album (ex Liu et al. 2023) TaxID=3031130 RepID=A0ABT5WQ57_9SPHN|nr:DUF5818 domain-containing protein [Novosphingobium album (ex Liu et al. 2023)]
MPRAPGNYRRLVGVLHMNGHSPMLEADDGRILRLISSDDLRGFDAVGVIVEGTLSGTNRLQLEWIGQRPE